MAFLLLAERWAAVNKAESVLKEQPLYQATSQHRVSTQCSQRVKEVSMFPLQTRMVNETASNGSLDEDDTESVFKSKWK